MIKVYTLMQKKKILVFLLLKWFLLIYKNIHRTIRVLLPVNCHLHHSISENPAEYNQPVDQFM